MFYWRRKYWNTKTTYKWIVFDSKKEARRYIELETLEKVGMISELETQPRYILQEKFTYRGENIRAITYLADFRYKQDWKVYVEDVKGGKATKTALYEVKKKILLKLYGENIIFLEI